MEVTLAIALSANFIRNANPLDPLPASDTLIGGANLVRADYPTCAKVQVPKSVSDEKQRLTARGFVIPL
jgi:hypothetical protein